MLCQSERSIRFHKRKHMSEKNYIKEAEANVIRIAKSFEDFLSILDAFANFGNRMCHQHIGKGQFFDGLSMMRSAIYKEYRNALANCFIFVGIGGEEAIEYSRKKFEEMFNEDERYVIMDFLDKYGQIPNSYDIEKEEGFRRQAKNALDKSRKE